MTAIFKNIRGVIWDWGDTLMRELPGLTGPMVDWPRVEAMPGALEALEALAPISIHAVATNAEDSDGKAVAAALARAGLAERMTHFFTSREMGVGKPDPEFFREVARRLGIPPKGLLSIGNDYRKDIRPADALGMATIWVSPRGATSGQDLEVEGAGICELPVHVDDPPRQIVVADLQELARLAPGWLG